MLNLSRTRVRKLILAELATDDPTRSRWLQEHPRSAEITNQLTSDAMDLLIDATRQRTQPPRAGFWSSVAETDVESTVVEMVLGAPDLWDSIDTEFPRQPPNSSDVEVMHRVMGDVPLSPGSGPTGTASPPAD